MRCFECEYLFQDDLDICPGCYVDVRPYKKELGLPVLYPDKTYQQLLDTYKVKNLNEPVKKNYNFKNFVLWLNKRLRKEVLSHQPEEAAVIPPPAEEKKTPQKNYRRVIVRSYHEEEETKAPVPEKIEVPSAKSDGAGIYFKPLSDEIESEFKQVTEDLLRVNKPVFNLILPSSRDLPYESISWLFHLVEEEIKTGKKKEFTLPDVQKKSIGSTRIERALKHLEEVEEGGSEERKEEKIIPILPMDRKDLILLRIKTVFYLLSFSLLITLLSSYLFRFPLEKILEPENILFSVQNFILSLTVSSLLLLIVPLVNDGKTLSGIYLLTEKGEDPNLWQLFIRVLLFPLLLIPFSWFSLFTRETIIETLLSLRTSLIRNRA